jgi:hypothetical protein
MLPPKDESDAREPFVTPLSMLIAALAVWLALFLVSIACFRVSALADSRDLALNARYPTASADERGYPADSPPQASAPPGEHPLHDEQPTPAQEPGRASRGTGHTLGI